MEWNQFIIYEKVQGMVYRKSASQALMKKQFKSYIQNLKDATVEVVSEVFDDAVFYTDGFEIG